MTVNTDNVPSQEKIETNIPQEKVETKTEVPVQESKAPEANAEDPNWRAFREARKKDRAEKEAAEKKAAEKEQEISALKAAMESAFSKSINPSQTQAPYSGYEQEETEDERIEKKVQAAIDKREAEAERTRQEREHQQYPQRLTQSYPDFHQAISQENLDYLDYHFPEVSRPLQRLHDGFDKWSDIYMAIKKFVPNYSSAKKDSARADANFVKPKSISSTGVTQPGEAMSQSRISEEKKAANWERMQKLLKGVG
jgi:hypothetical protein